MFEKLVSDLLNSFLGNYFENIDTSNLDISTWRGDVQLKELVIKQTALDELDLPVRPFFGYLECLKLKIPWRELYTGKWEAILEGLSLIVVPTSSIPYDSQKEEKLLHDTKLATLQKIEEAKQRNKKKTQGKGKEKDTFLEKLIAQVIRNLQIEIKNIYLRYEDSITSPSKPFAVGAMLPSLNLQSTDSNWVVGLDTATLIYKLLNLEGLMAYWTPEPRMISKLEANKEEINQILKQHLHTDHHEILRPMIGPLNLLAHLQLNPRPELGDEPFTTPKAVLDVVLKGLSVGVSRHQFSGIMNLLDSLGRMQIASKYRKYRPKVNSIMGHASLWWRFAYDCQLEDIRRHHQNWSWNHMKNHRDKCRIYRNLYKQKLGGGSYPKDEIEELEKILDVFNLTLIRRLAEMELEREGLEQAEAQKKKGWLGGWFSWGSKTDPQSDKEATNIVEKFEAQMSDGDKNKLYEAIGYSEDGIPPELPINYVDISVKFILKELSLTITDELLDNSTVLTLSLSQLESAFSSRSAASSIRVEASIHSFEIVGLQQPEREQPQLTKSLNISEESPLLLTIFETNPLDEECDTRVKIDAQPLEIIYDAATITQVADIFSPPKDISLQQLQAAALNQLEIVRERSAAGLQSAIENRTILDLHIKIEASRLIFPELGYNDLSKSVIVMTLGSITIKSSPNEDKKLSLSHSSEDCKQNHFFEQLKSASYDYFSFYFSDIQILVADSGEDWISILSSKEQTPLHLLMPLSLSVDIFKCLITNDPNLPKFKISANLPQISFFIIDSKLIKAAAVINNCFNQEPSSPSSPDDRCFLQEEKDYNQNVITDEVALVRLQNADFNPTGESSSTPQFTDLVFNFTINAITMNLMKSKPDEDSTTPLLRLSVGKMSLDFVQKTFDQTVDLMLSHISLMHLEWGEQHILKTQISPEDSALFSLKFIQVNPKNPDFQTYHQGVIQRIGIEMSSLSARLEETLIMSLLSFASTLESQLSAFVQSKNIRPVDLKPSISYDDKSSQSIKKTTEIKCKPPPQHKKKVTAKLAQIELTIGRSSYDIASLYIQGLAADFIIEGKETELYASLKDFAVMNPNVEELYHDIVCMEDSHAWEIRIKMFDNSPDELEYFDVSKVDMSIWINLGRPKVTFLNKVVADLLAWIDNFQEAKDALSSASQAAAEAAKANLKEAYSRRSKVKIDLLLKAPLIMIPNNSKSYQGLLVDLGNIRIRNHFRLGDKRNELGHPNLFNDMNLLIQDVKISRKADLRFSKENSLLMPLSLNLDIQMNLSSWEKSLPELQINAELKAIQVQLSETDICTVLSVLQGNLGETPRVQPPKLSDVPEVQAAIQKMKAKEEILIEHTRPYSKLTATFRIEEISLELFTSDNHLELVDEENCGRCEFAKISISDICLKFDMLSDETISANLILLDCTLRDLRKDFQDGITYMLEKKNKTSATSQPIFDITFIHNKRKDIFVDLKVSEFLLIIHFPFLLRMQQLLSVQPPQDMDEMAISLAAEEDSGKVVTKEQMKTIDDDSTITISIKVEQPDIVLIEDLRTLDSSCIILHAEIDAKCRIASSSQRNVSAALNNVQMYTCCYNPPKREASSSQILSRSEIKFSSSATTSHADNIHISSGTLEFRVAPDTIELVMSILNCLLSEENQVVQAEESRDWSGYWESKDIDFNELPNLKIETAREAELDLIEPLPKSEPAVASEALGGETLCVEMDCLLITLEAGSGSTAIPLLKLQSSCILTAHGFFSSKLTANGHLDFEVAYYNPKQAIWEPLLEPVEELIPSGKPGHRSWNVGFEAYAILKEEDKQVTSPEVSSSTSCFSLDDFDLIVVPPPLTKVSLLAKDPLELTITKTFLEVLNVLSESFMEAYKGELSVRQGAKAPFKFFNSTGIILSINMKQSGLQLSATGDSDLEEIILESGGETELYSSMIGSRQHRRHMSLVTQYQTAMERIVEIKIPFLGATCTIPITKAGKRLFSIPLKNKPNEKWGLVASIVIIGGQKVITFSSCVKIVNELDEEVDVYYMTERGNQVELVCSLLPKEMAMLPCHAVYTPSNELFFSVKGYSVCISPLIWKIQNFPNLQQELHCQPRSKKHIHDRPFMFTANCEVEHIYWGNTSRRTIESIMVQVNLRPLITLHNLLPIAISLFPPGTVSEKRILLPGSSLQLTHAQLGLIYLEIEILSYRNSDWVCSKALESDPPELSVWSFQKRGEKESGFTLDLGMHIRKLKGINILSLYCPFWMVNKTNLDLTYKTDNSYTLLHEKGNLECVLFSFRSKSFFGKKKSCLKVQESEWSEKFPMDTVGSCGGVSCNAKNRTYQVSIDIQLGASGLTKIVTFSAFHKAINRCPYDLEFCFEGDHSKTWHAMPAGECIGLWPPGTSKACSFRVLHTTEVSPPVHFDTAHATLFKLNNKYGGFFTEVSVSQGGTVISLDQCMEGVAAALVVNHLKFSSVALWQSECESHKVEIGPQRMKYFTWQSAKNNQTVQLSCLGLSPISIPLNEDKKGTLPDGKAGWATWLNGAQRCLIISEDSVLLEGPLLSCELERTNTELELSIHSIGLSLVDDLQSKEIFYLSMSSSGVAWENQKTSTSKFRPFTEAETLVLEKAFVYYTNVKKTEEETCSVVQLPHNIEVDFEEMKILKPFNRNIRRVFQYGVWLQVQLLNAQRNLHVKVNKLQLDNQLPDVMFPVVLARVPLPKSVMTETVPKPFFEMSVIQSLESSIITQYKYFSVLVQEFHIKVELPFIFAILEAIYPSDSIEGLYSPEMYQKDMIAISQPISSMVTSHIRSSKRDFFNYLHLSPIKMHLSFSLTGLDSTSSIPIGGQVLHVFLQSVGVTLTEVQDVIFRLGYLEKRHCWLTKEGLMEMVQVHYTHQVMTQLYVVVLGLDVIGNPINLVLGMTKGFGDLFYEPIQGAVEGPNEFAQGLFYGMRSFMGKTVGGTADAFSRITGTIGKGVATLTFDEDYQRRRREAINKKPADGLEAMARGGKGLFTGVFDGVTGVFLKPIEGAKQEGVEGFFKGVGKGVVGLVTRPASGLIDFTSGSLDAVMRATDSTEDVIQVRPPRFINPDAIIRPFVYRHAAGSRLLKTLERGKFAPTDHYVIHSLVSDERSIILASDKRIFLLGRNEILGQWKIEWMHIYEELAEAPHLVHNKMKFPIKTPKKKVLGVFGGGSNVKEVTLHEVSEHEWIINQIAEAYRRTTHS